MSILKRKCLFAIFLAAAGAVFSQQIGISGVVDWNVMEISAVVTLDLASAGVKLPSGRTQGENIIDYGYLRLIQGGILGMQVDSSSTIADLIARGEMTIFDVEYFALGAESEPPALSLDLRSMFASYTINIGNISSSLIRHSRAAPIPRTLNAVTTQAYTGIIIIANESLPVHGMRSSAVPVPCLFPKIWDTEMNLIFERNMLEPAYSSLHYAPASGIFANSPSGLTPEMISVVGQRPMRIIARGVFGITPTDIIIDRADALAIISSAENRRLLSEGRVAIILDDSVLQYDISR
jgi:hypothetical protein